MAPNKSDLGGSLHLDEAVDPKLGVWGTLKEAARITIEHKSILVVLLLVLVPLAAFTTSTEMRRVRRRVAAVHDVVSAKQLCYEHVIGPAIAAKLPPTSMPGYEKYCRPMTRSTPAQTVAIMRKTYGGGWYFLEIAVTLILASVAHAAIVRAVVQAYDVEEESYGGVAEWLKLQFNRKLVEASMRTLGTTLFAMFVVYGALFFTLSMTYLVYVLVTPLKAAVAVSFLILVPASAGMLHLATSFFLAYTVCAVEAGTWGVRALSRSSKLITGHRRKSVVFMLLFALPFLLSASLIHAAGTGLLKPSIGLAACIMALQILLAYLSEVAPTVFYLKCRAYCSTVKNEVELGGRGYLPLEKLVEEDA